MLESGIISSKETNPAGRERREKCQRLAAAHMRKRRRKNLQLRRSAQPGLHLHADSHPGEKQIKRNFILSVVLLKQFPFNYS